MNADCGGGRAWNPRPAGGLAWVGFFFLFCLASLHAQQNVPLSTAPILNPDKQGAELAARLRGAVPAEPDEVKGTLEIISRDDTITTIPVVSRIIPGISNWSVTYLASGSDGRVLEELTIVHTPGQSNTYSLRRPDGPPADGGKSTVESLFAHQLARPFAATDFWVGDLGLEFLHWPGQRVLTNTMSRSRSCWILESTTPGPPAGGYSRVLSWVDVEHEGILSADAYDLGSATKPMKEFRLGGVRRKDGLIESMKMRTLRTGSETELKFDLPRKE